jgi:cyclic beta-1,2-glucan glucanotransferase
MVRRFHADERVQSIELLLQEKIPQNPHIEHPHPEETGELQSITRSVNIAPWRVPADSPNPQVHVLAQGSYSLLITNAGSGYSQWQEFALTRWQSDTTLDHWGTWIYLQDRDNGEHWSVTSQPTGCSLENQDILFSPHKVEFRRWDHGISLHTEITVGGDEVEIRRVTLLNDSDHPRHLKLTSYGEVVLAPQAIDQRHPAFNKLFIESEYVPGANALLFSRRSRSPHEKSVFMAHALVVEPGQNAPHEYEGNRVPFLGRGQTPRSPVAMEDRDSHLSGTVGGTLDPIMSLAQEIDLKPHTKTQVTFLTLAAPSRQEALDLVTRYQSRQMIHRAFDEARTRGEKELIELGLNANNVEHIQQLLSALLSPANPLRAAPDIIAKNKKGQAGLWAYGISGDYPILLVHVLDGTQPLLQEALQAYSYWRNRQVKINLVILNDQDTGYTMDLHNVIYNVMSLMGVAGRLNQRDGIFLLRTDQIPDADRILLETVAGVILDDKIGTLADHASRLTKQPIRLPAFTPAIHVAEDPETTPPVARPVDLLMDNGLGGFSPDGKEYVIYLQPGQHTPHPWVNVVANPQFGFLVSEAGGGCSWAVNSSENRLTPWRNDPLTDMPGEALYLRDEETGLVWSPTPMPAGAATAYLIRHGAGYSTFENQSYGLNQCLRLFAAPDAPIKIAHLRLQNLWGRPRRITVTYYAEWVLGTTRDINQFHIIPEFEPDQHALLASNHFVAEFGDRVAFLAANKRLHGLTTDRTEFLGRMGSMRTPAALARIGLASTVQPGQDPCAAIQLHVDLAPGQTEEVYFLLGEGPSRQESLALIDAYQAPAQVESAWQAVHTLWDDVLGTITVQTPDAGMDLMLNRWLLYQTLGCRLWGRTAQYQSSGAFGFRDQLQDVLALLHARPDLAREQIINAAQHQFEAGDVLHWWNPPSGRGVRTRFSDDLLWLPFVTADYVTATGDQSVLTEKIPFLKGELLKPEETDRYSQYESTTEAYTLYEHCRRAVAKGSTAGIHGLPLMGEGDWNDGMNRVGAEGRGESVWLGWFLHATLLRFANLCAFAQDDPEPYLQQAERLSQAIEAHAWDGNWYLRAYYDDGSSLGSSQNAECQIDSIAQAWAVLSGAADRVRAEQAMESVNRLLIKQADQLIMLFTPPFDKTLHNPGYIKGYLPGVRENGGQYTHAATWSVWAYALLGQGDRAQALYRLLNPIYHSDTPEKAARYKTEPYNIAADIYSAPPHTGAGGWTGYTGSAGWMYRLGMEAILGVSRLGNVLRINPCIPQDWPGYKITYQFGTTRYLISVENPDGVNQGIRRVLLDGKTLTDNHIPLSSDGQQHEVHVLLGPTVSLKREESIAQ